MKIIIFIFVAISFLLSGCDQTKLLAKLESADVVRAYVGDQERIIHDKETILSICHAMTAPERKWSTPTSFSSLPFPPQRAFFEKDGSRFAYVAFGSDWLLIKFYPPESASRSCVLTESDYKTISKLLGR